jgi:YD repeat-containing protein
VSARITAPTRTMHLALLRRRLAPLFACSLIAVPACTSRTRTTSTYPDGARNLEIEWRGRARDGRSAQYYPDGKLALEAHYALGLRDGPWKMRYANGRQAISGTFVHGLRDGAWTEWGDDGAKLLEGTWHAGEKTGTWLEYDAAGKLVAREMFDDGTRLARLPAAEKER